MPEQKKFVLYEHLLFMWKKKVFFIIIPLIFALIGFGATYLIAQEGQYVGTALIFKGSIKQGALNSKENIIDEFGPDVEDEDEEEEIEITSPVNDYIKIKIISDNRKKLETDLEDMALSLEKALLDQSTLRLGLTDKQKVAKDEWRTSLLATGERLEEKLIGNGDLTATEINDLSISLAEIVNTSKELLDEINRMQNDIDLFEEPKIVNQQVEVAEINTYKAEFTIAGLILGLLLTFLVLILWKYIIDARRYKQHD